MIPLFIPPYVHALTWINAIYLLIKFDVAQYNLLTAMRSVPGSIIILSISYFPLAFMLISRTAEKIPTQLIHAARMTHSTLSIITHIILPLIKGSIITAALLVFVLAFNTFDVPAYFETNVFLTEIFTQFSSKFNTLKALQLSAVPFVISAGLWTMALLIPKETPFYTTSQLREGTKPEAPQVITRSIKIIIVLFAIIGIGIPLFSILFGSILFNPVMPQDIHKLQPVIIDTTFITILSSFVTVIMGIGTYLIFYRNKIGRITLLSLLAVPAMTYAILFITGFNRASLQWIYGSPLVLLAAYGLRFLPIISEIIYGHVQFLNQQFLQASLLVRPIDYISIRKIILPLMMPALVIGWGIAWWLAASELPITLLIQPPGFQTITSRLYIFLHYGSKELMNTLTLLLLVLCFIPIIIVQSLVLSKQSNVKKRN